MLLNIFSKRVRRAHGGDADVYVYDRVPHTLRVQIVHILREVLATDSEYDNKLEPAAKEIHDALAREYGVFALAESLKYEGHARALFDFTLKTEQVEQILDVVELSLIYATSAQANYGYHDRPLLRVDEAIAELNARFRENAVGYQFESGLIVRVDSQIIHKEVVKPALHLLGHPDLSGANQEFLTAHEHYRNGRHKEAINECLKAFESVMKVICARRGWGVEPNATAKRLIEVCFTNQLIPDYLQSEFGSLRSALESGIPTVRNRTSGHGQGQAPNPVPAFVAGYLLHLTAATVVFLVDAEKALP